MQLTMVSVSQYPMENLPVLKKAASLFDGLTGTK